MKNTEKEVINIVEELNLECIKREEEIKKLRMTGFRRKIKEFKENRIYGLISHKPLENGYTYSKNNIIKDKPKIVVYSCITGNYDKILEPTLLFDDVKFSMYTDNCNIKAENWTIRNIDEFKQSDNILANRYAKFHPFELFKDTDYDYSIYIDGNVKVVGDIRSLIYSVSEKTGLSLHRHIQRDDVYKEAKACILLKKGEKHFIKKQMKKYQALKFPKKYGLLECTIIVTDLSNLNAKKIYKEWWKEFIDSKSMRDQLSLPYTLWKFGYTLDDVGSLGDNEYRNPIFRIYSH